MPVRPHVEKLLVQIRNSELELARRLLNTIFKNFDATFPLFVSFTYPLVLGLPVTLHILPSILNRLLEFGKHRHHRLLLGSLTSIDTLRSFLLFGGLRCLSCLDLGLQCQNFYFKRLDGLLRGGVLCLKVS